MATILVIGGGIVGICSALALQQDGHQVTILDAGAVGEGASWASCGSIAVSEVIPLSKPGTLKRAPKWLLDPLGPLTLRASSALKVLPWFLSFLGNASPQRIQQISEELSLLSRNALSDTEALLARYELSHLLRQTAVLELYDQADELAHERPFHHRRRDLGFKIREISGQEAKELEPSIAGDFACATVFDDWRSVLDPKRLVSELHKVFLSKGGKVIAEHAVGWVREDQKLTAVQSAAGTHYKADQFVLAAGAHSKQLAAPIGVKLAIEGVIGYQTLLQQPEVQVEHALIYAKGGFGITPYESGLAVAGSIEFADLQAEPNWKRADILVEKAKRVLPALNTQAGKKIIGRRPLTPDTKPVIGYSQQLQNLIFATGHGQLGVTLAATTGQLVSDLAAGRQPRIALAAYSPDRF